MSTHEESVTQVGFEPLGHNNKIFVDKFSSDQLSGHYVAAAERLPEYSGGQPDITGAVDTELAAVQVQDKSIVTYATLKASTADHSRDTHSIWQFALGDDGKQYGPWFVGDYTYTPFTNWQTKNTVMPAQFTIAAFTYGVTPIALVAPVRGAEADSPIGFHTSDLEGKSASPQVNVAKTSYGARPRYEVAAAVLKDAKGQDRLHLFEAVGEEKPSVVEWKATIYHRVSEPYTGPNQLPAFLNAPVAIVTDVASFIALRAVSTETELYLFCLGAYSLDMVNFDKEGKRTDVIKVPPDSRQDGKYNNVAIGHLDEKLYLFNDKMDQVRSYDPSADNDNGAWGHWVDLSSPASTKDPRATSTVSDHKPPQLNVFSLYPA